MERLYTEKYFLPLTKRSDKTDRLPVDNNDAELDNLIELTRL